MLFEKILPHLELNSNVSTEKTTGVSMLAYILYMYILVKQTKKHLDLQAI